MFAFASEKFVIAAVAQQKAVIAAIEGETLRRALDRVNKSCFRCEYQCLGGRMDRNVMSDSAKADKFSRSTLENRNAAQAKQSAFALGGLYLLIDVAERGHRLSTRMASIITFGKSLEAATGVKRLANQEAGRHADYFDDSCGNECEAKSAIDLPDPIAGLTRDIVEAGLGVTHALRYQDRFVLFTHEAKEDSLGSRCQEPQLKAKTAWLETLLVEPIMTDTWAVGDKTPQDRVGHGDRCPDCGWQRRIERCRKFGIGVVAGFEATPVVGDECRRPPDERPKQIVRCVRLALERRGEPENSRISRL